LEFPSSGAKKLCAVISLVLLNSNAAMNSLSLSAPPTCFVWLN